MSLSLYKNVVGGWSKVYVIYFCFVILFFNIFFILKINGSDDFYVDEVYLLMISLDKINFVGISDWELI